MQQYFLVYSSATTDIRARDKHEPKNTKNSSKEVKCERSTFQTHGIHSYVKQKLKRMRPKGGDGRAEYYK